MFIEKDTKTNRILMIYSKLISGKIINKKELSKVCNVSEKTIQRDIEDIKAYFYDKRDVDMGKDIEYISREKGYYLKNNDKSLSSQDVLAMVKVLLESRAFCREELNHIISSLLKQVEDEQSKYIYINDYDMLFAWSGSLVIDIWVGGEAILNQHLFKVTSDKYDQWYYYYWSKHFLDEFIEIARNKATTMGHINRTHLSDAKVLLPDDKAYKEMSSVLGNILNIKMKNKKQNQILSTFRDTLLPKLMSGEIRIPLD